MALRATNHLDGIEICAACACRNGQRCATTQTKLGIVTVAFTAFLAFNGHLGSPACFDSCEADTLGPQTLHQFRRVLLAAQGPVVFAAKA